MPGIRPLLARCPAGLAMAYDVEIGRVNVAGTAGRLAAIFARRPCREAKPMKKFCFGLMFILCSSGALADKTEAPAGAAAAGDSGPPEKTASPSMKTIVKVVGAVVVVVVAASAKSSSTTSH